MPLEEDLERQFTEQGHTGLLLNADARFVMRYYPDGQMVIAGEGREMPPLMLFRRRTILFSSDGVEWEPATEQAGALALLALLDPRRVVRAAIAIEENIATVDVRQILGDAGQSTDDPSLEGQQQRVEFRTRGNGIVTEMVQPDIGDPEVLVTVRFIPAMDITLPQP